MVGFGVTQSVGPFAPCPHTLPFPPPPHPEGAEDPAADFFDLHVVGQRVDDQLHLLRGQLHLKWRVRWEWRSVDRRDGR